MSSTHLSLSSDTPPVQGTPAPMNILSPSLVSTEWHVGPIATQEVLLVV